jgi:hypothetical protein
VRLEAIELSGFLSLDFSARGLLRRGKKAESARPA